LPLIEQRSPRLLNVFIMTLLQIFHLITLNKSNHKRLAVLNSAEISFQVFVARTSEQVSKPLSIGQCVFTDEVEVDI
jgi:hypothetical protein